MPWKRRPHSLPGLRHNLSLPSNRTLACQTAFFRGNCRVRRGHQAGCRKPSRPACMRGRPGDWPRLPTPATIVACNRTCTSSDLPGRHSFLLTRRFATWVRGRRNRGLLSSCGNATCPMSTNRWNRLVRCTSARKRAMQKRSSQGRELHPGLLVSSVTALSVRICTRP
jgi:hypothetical protein